ncbi:MAG: hypothetical protein AB7G34_11980 [Hyphomicrobiales bacterium]
MADVQPKDFFKVLANGNPREPENASPPLGIGLSLMVLVSTSNSGHDNSTRTGTDRGDRAEQVAFS